MGDVAMILGILTTLVLMGVFIPLLEGELGYAGSEYNVSGLVPLDPANDTESTSPTATIPLTGGLFVGMIKAFGWSWGWFPFWLVALHVVIRIVMVLLIYRQVRSGGG